MNLPSPVHVILPVHNRRDVTLACLRHLHATGVADFARLVVVDDGSTDGTAEAIRAGFPQTTVLPGDGHLYWTGGIARGMRHAVSEHTACCVWLNDDSHPRPGAVELIVADAVARGGITSALGRLLAGPVVADFYALRKIPWGLTEHALPPSAGQRLKVDACRGNLVAIPRKVIDAIGYPDAEDLPQYMGDTDYTLRATAAGFQCIVDRGAIVEELIYSGNFDEPWLTTSEPLRQIWARVFKIQAALYWRPNWVYLRRHWGRVRGTLLFFRLYGRLTLISFVRLVVPYRFLKGRRPERNIRGMWTESTVDKGPPPR